MDYIYRFQLDDPLWRDFLDVNGFVVIANYVSVAQAFGYLQQMWSDIETLSGGRVERDLLQSRCSTNYPYVMHGGMIQYLGHSQLQWDIREISANMFAILYNTDVTNLSSSFDGLCFMDGQRRYHARKNTSFLHVDQAPSKNFQYSVQGFLNLVNCGPDDGGLVVIPSSHNYTEYWALHPARDQTKDWYLFTENEKSGDPMFDQDVKVCCSAGDFILWDSRTWHCNTVPRNPSLRAVVYVCMLPKDRITDKIKKARAAAAKSGRVSSHHPGAGFSLFPKKPRWCTDEMYAIAHRIQSELNMTPLQKILADVD